MVGSKIIEVKATNLIETNIDFDHDVNCLYGK